MTRFVCIHGHFYQPPRANPWLGTIEPQPSAAPYHDWNERVWAECYEPNAAARLLDDEGKVVRTVNNYERISFNFGPTLLDWLERHGPETYRAVIEADRRARARFSGHGSALAQVYGHPILPLCNSRDRQTQVRWAIRDFEHRFGRSPEGMWLPETAVDSASLETLAGGGISFTVLAPGQAGHVRGPGEDDWRPTAGEIDPRRPYLCRLPSGKRIAVFFYDGELAHAIAFGRLLANGDSLAGHLLGAFDEQDPTAQLVHVATDGETYGHHHKFGEMALARALDRLDGGTSARLTNYGEFLAHHAPEWEVRIVERSSWSCPHGLERWQSDCGCASEYHAGWHQRWRQPLRTALDWLRDTLSPPFERQAARFVVDPWAARDEYIDLLLDPSEEARLGFFARHAPRALSPHEQERALELFDLQRHALLMYASCGWFFEDLARIEPVQILRHASRVLELASRGLALDLEEPFLRRLADAPANARGVRNGRTLYERRVRTARPGSGRAARRPIRDSR